MTTQNSQSVPPQGSHHYVMTVELPGRAMQTLSGTWTPPQGATRHDVFSAIKADIGRQDPEMGGANVVFFSLEPNHL
ncbi:hypothetical protein E2C00_08485 [Streptomyces sp. WAC05374]|uniref:hypothetical protein n=1 Tax=Streptomyces sp. WAC05374 TaxID=2487420 RepID=UPI000F892681|nr:hypothetical protein [Streptomyces sp. WAC05374]RST19342.1 hypothetical protein EF905_01785 [Streptomyces sp. WAC05374]TDF47664.1 hypothetical protein E2C02_30055 [Streptomyces sp. WAC05374]TDF48672.1 hypothetical protein E2B92_07375 [Streptomyces sp. WAC05374]TDF59078.1 hypothetical protein E2C00_08485 [Streptomyces sp. WAC05374]